MNKRFKILVFALLFSFSAQAQIFIMEEENNRPDGEEVLGWPVNPPLNNQGNDDYVPIGGGVFLLTALGGAYLLKKERNK